MVRPRLEVLEDRVVPATKEWFGAGLNGTGNWNVGPWNPAGAPGAADTALFDFATTRPTLTAAVAGITSMDVWGKQAGTDTQLDMAGFNVTVTGLTLVHSEAFGGGRPRAGVAGDGVFTLTNTGAAATYNTDTLDVGISGFSNLVNLIQNRAFLKVGQKVTVKVTGQTRVGGNTTGLVALSNGGQIQGAQLNIGGVSSTTDQPRFLSGLTVDGKGTLADFSGIAIGEGNGYAGARTFGGKTRYSGIWITNQGKVNVGANKLKIGTSYMGVVSVRSGGQLVSASDVTVGDADNGTLIVQDNGSTLTVTGTIFVADGFRGGTFTVDDGATVSASKLEVGTGSKGTMTVGGGAGAAAVNVTGTTAVRGKGTLLVNNNGTVTSTGAFTVDKGGTTKVGSGGTLDAKAGGTNNGTLQIDTGAGFKTHPQGAINKGVVQIAGLNGVGTGTAVVAGNFTQQAPGELDININGNVPGASYDVLAVNPLDGGDGNAVLGGNLVVSSSYAPTPWTPSGPGDYFTVVKAATSLSGQFDTLSLPNPNNLGLPSPDPGMQYKWKVVYDTTDQYNSALAQSDPLLASQPWTGNGTDDVVLLIEEIPATTPTTTTLTAFPNPATFGQTVTLSAVVSGNPGTPTGAVEFYVGGAPLGSAPLDGTGTAQLTTSSLAVGSYTLTASYLGDANFETSDSAPVNLTVTLAPSSTTLASSLNPANFGDIVTFTATVAGNATTPTGSVSFMEGGTVLDTEPLDETGAASFSISSLSVGTHDITAVYSGDSSFASSSSGALAQEIDAAPTTTTLTASASTVTLGDSVTFTAAVDSNGNIPTGTVSFFDNGTLLGTGTLDSNGTATLQTSALTLGTNNVEADYGGDGSFAASASGTVTVTVVSGGSGGSIGDWVWNDADHNGIQEPGEAGLAGVTVNLLDGLGNWLQSTSTDGTGHYTFNNLSAGNYELQVVAPAGYVFSPEHQGSDPTLDSDADSTGLIAPISLSANQIRTDLDAGLYSNGSGGSGGNIGRPVVPPPPASGPAPTLVGSAPLTVTQPSGNFSAALAPPQQDGLSAGQANQLTATPLLVGRPSDGMPVLAQPGRVDVDANPTGAGWFMEPIPGQDVNFGPGAAGVLPALTNGPTAGHDNLRTAVFQGLGQEAGVDSVALADLLAPGVLNTAAVDAIFGGP
jgi:T5SS/PEP-CTERM-associated repeat protein